LPVFTGGGLLSHKEACMNLYETIFILKPDLTEEENQQWIQRVLQVIEQNNGELVRLDTWGLEKLAYSIKKYPKGYFVYAVFQGPYACIQEMDRHFKMLDPFLRHLIVKLDDRELEKHQKAEMLKKTAAESHAAEPPEKPVNQVEDTADSATEEKTEEAAVAPVVPQAEENTEEVTA